MGRHWPPRGCSLARWLSLAAVVPHRAAWRCLVLWGRKGRSAWCARDTRRPLPAPCARSVQFPGSVARGGGGPPPRCALQAPGLCWACCAGGACAPAPPHGLDRCLLPLLLVPLVLLLLLVPWLTKSLLVLLLPWLTTLLPLLLLLLTQGGAARGGAARACAHRGRWRLRGRAVAQRGGGPGGAQRSGPGR